jgi:glutathione peroxidase
MNLYDINVKAQTGNDVPLSDYKDKVLLVVNTATKCGFTPQYDGLQSLYEDYNEKGFVVLDFPCNQFANQAPENNDEINEFCTLNFNTTFPRFAKIDVNGNDEAELYKYLKSQKKSLFGKDIKWNFTKFLVDKHGNVVSRYSPNTAPDKIRKDIEKLLV